MGWRNKTARCRTLSIGFHWFVPLVLEAVYACLDLGKFIPKDRDPREALKAWHSMLGLSVLTLVLLRLVMRMTSPVPSAPPDLPAWQRRVAKRLNYALYGFMIRMPLAG